MAKPRFISPCVANRYTGPNERIAEFSFGEGAGGLISLRRLNDGSNRIHLYRLDGCNATIEKTRPQLVETAVETLTWALDSGNVENVKQAAREVRDLLRKGAQ